VSAKTNANVEDLFNRVIDDLQTVQASKKKEPTAASSGLSEPEAPPAGKEEGKIKLGAASSGGGGERGWAGCCQR
jgi:hypothetical protein